MSMKLDKLNEIIEEQKSTIENLQSRLETKIDKLLNLHTPSFVVPEQPISAPVLGTDSESSNSRPLTLLKLRNETLNKIPSGRKRKPKRKIKSCIGILDHLKAKSAGNKVRFSDKGESGENSAKTLNQSKYWKS